MTKVKLQSNPDEIDYMFLRDYHGWFLFDSLKDIVRFNKEYPQAMDNNRFLLDNIVLEDDEEEEFTPPFKESDIDYEAIDEIIRWYKLEHNHLYDDDGKLIFPHRDDINNVMKDDMKSDVESVMNDDLKDCTSDDTNSKFKHKLKSKSKRKHKSKNKSKLKSKMKRTTRNNQYEGDILCTDNTHIPKENHFYDTVVRFVDKKYDPEKERQKYSYTKLEKYRKEQ